MNIQDALEIASQTDPGMVRSHNEDSVACEPVCGLVVLADGMGGYNAGEVASGIAVSVVATEISYRLQGASPTDRDESSGDELAVSLLRDYIQKANASIYHASQSQPQYSGMGTTIVAGLFYDNRVAVAHVGDSRMYRLRGETLEAITRDHSLLQEQIDGGIISAADARLSKNKNLVTRAVGIDPEVEAEIHVHDVLAGDIYLLCSDGLNDMVEDDDIQSTLYAMQGNLPLAAGQLVQMANDNGGRDNISVILVKIKGRYAASRGWLAKLRDWFAWVFRNTLFTY
ncbi:MAG: Stp1/IreP family PP2C-type Ser/Thr phosphatase [Gallionella sp.]|nr:Stp1/IreP family PP2C-type Ser/Thr phosphatase [Gallionella sp.]